MVRTSLSSDFQGILIPSGTTFNQLCIGLFLRQLPLHVFSLSLFCLSGTACHVRLPSHVRRHVLNYHFLCSSDCTSYVGLPSHVLRFVLLFLTVHWTVPPWCVVISIGFIYVKFWWRMSLEIRFCGSLCLCLCCFVVELIITANSCFVNPFFNNFYKKYKLS